MSFYRSTKQSQGQMCHPRLR